MNFHCFLIINQSDRIIQKGSRDQLVLVTNTEIISLYKCSILNRNSFPGERKDEWDRERDYIEQKKNLEQLVRVTQSRPQLRQKRTVFLSLSWRCAFISHQQFRLTQNPLIFCPSIEMHSFLPQHIQHSSWIWMNIHNSLRPSRQQQQKKTQWELWTGKIINYLTLRHESTVCDSCKNTWKKKKRNLVENVCLGSIVFFIHLLEGSSTKRTTFPVAYLSSPYSVISSDVPKGNSVQRLCHTLGFVFVLFSFFFFFF